MLAGLDAVLRGERRSYVAHGHALDVLAAWPEACVHCVVTSPPYYRLRDNQVPPVGFGGDAACTHAWEEGRTPGIAGGAGPRSQKCKIKGSANFQYTHDVPYWRCARCGAWCGQLGWEPTVAEYAEHLRQLCAAVRRVLHPRGTLWLNLGDSYAGSGRGPQRGDPAYKPKDLQLVPYAVARRLQEDGWWVRAVVPWIKLGAFGHPVRDRPLLTVEWLFQLTRSAQYHYDADAAARPWRTDPTRQRRYRATDGFCDSVEAAIEILEATLQALRAVRHGDMLLQAADGTPLAIVARAGQYRGPHFSAFPERLVAPLIRASAPRTVCATCWAPAPCAAHPQAARLPGLVLDPLAGAGTTGVAALRLGRRFVGIELQRAYVRLARERLRPLDPPTALLACVE